MVEAEFVPRGGYLPDRPKVSDGMVKLLIPDSAATTNEKKHRNQKGEDATTVSYGRRLDCCDSGERRWV